MYPCILRFTFLILTFSICFVYIFYFKVRQSITSTVFRNSDVYLLADSFPFSAVMSIVRCPLNGDLGRELRVDLAVRHSSSEWIQSEQIFRQPWPIYRASTMDDAKLSPGAAAGGWEEGESKSSKWQPIFMEVENVSKRQRSNSKSPERELGEKENIATSLVGSRVLHSEIKKRRGNKSSVKVVNGHMAVYGSCRCPSTVASISLIPLRPSLALFMLSFLTPATRARERGP